MLLQKDPKKSIHPYIFIVNTRATDSRGIQCNKIYAVL